MGLEMIWGDGMSDFYWEVIDFIFWGYNDYVWEIESIESNNLNSQLDEKWLDLYGDNEWERKEGFV